MNPESVLKRTSLIAVLLAVLVVLVYSARYLPEAPVFFMTVVAFRFAAAFLPTVFVFIAILVISKLLGRASSIQRATAFSLYTFALVACLMVLASIAAPFPDGMFNAYLVHR